MFGLTVIDHSAEASGSPRRYDFDIDVEELIADMVKGLIQESSGIEPDYQILLYEGRAILDDQEILPLDPDVRLEIHLHRRPPIDQMLYVVTHRGADNFCSTHCGDATVADLKRCLARRFLVRPALQQLFSLEAFMMDDDPLGSFAVSFPILVHLCEEEKFFEDRQEICVSVKSRRGPGYQTFIMAAEDTFDMLVGRLELEGEVREGEQVTFVSDGVEFDNWKTFAEYEMTHAMLRISE